MPQETWTAKRERQYDHIKEGLLERGDSEELAEEIAARTVNKERARAGETKESSRVSIDDISSSRRRRCAFSPRPRWPDSRSALGRSATPRGQGAFDRVQGPARAGGGRPDRTERLSEQRLFSVDPRDRVG